MAKSIRKPIISLIEQHIELDSILKTKLITPEGYKKLFDEHDYLWMKQRPEITKIVTWAASLGDRSENADYTYNKRLLRQIDRRVRFLRKLLPELRVVHHSPVQDGKVFFGAWVEIENEKGEVKCFRIVGPEEIYGEDNKFISIDSPMARALIKKSVDDVCTVKTPSGTKEWFIKSIEYKNAFEKE
ncbi:MAG: transcription elongation factor GreB [Paraglaciecola sp.]